MALDYTQDMPAPRSTDFDSAGFTAPRVPAAAAKLRDALCIATTRGHERLVRQLRPRGWALDVVHDCLAAIEHIQRRDLHAGVIIIEPGGELGWLGQLFADPRTTAIEWIALASPLAFQVPQVREFIAARCFDYHTLPVDLPRLDQSLGHAQGMATLAQTALSKQPHARLGEDTLLVGESPAMKRVLQTIKKFAWSDLPVLIGGESGTGKEQIARTLHARSRRADAPFVAVNCAALTPGLIQSELFGHEKGAFTGAHRGRTGRIEAARGGTILLDEVGDLPGEVQVSLLRFLEESTIERVGASETIDVDVRVIAATHVDLEAAVARGDFREDLYYRLNVLRIEVPPLRRRPEDLPILAEHFWRQQSKDGGIRARGFSEGALRALKQHSWAGNVRELLNRVSQACVMCEGRLISREDLGLERRREPRHLTSLKDARDAAERRAIMASLEWAEGNISRAAKALGVSRIHLYTLIERHGLEIRR